MVFQSYSLFPNLNVALNVDFGLRTRKIPSLQRKHRVDGDARARPAHRVRRPLSAPAVGRPAATRRPRPGARRAARGAAARRAAVGARRQGAPLAARRDPPDPDRARHHDAARDPRPGGSARHLRSDRRDVAGSPRAARHAGRGLPPSGQRLRRPVRRLDERAPGHRRRRRQRAGRRHRRRRAGRQDAGSGRA